jgi:hypothetical protein
VSQSQPPAAAGDPDALSKVQQYRHYVLEYEALDEEIDGLLMQHHGASDQLSDEDYERYRALAHRRDYVHNRMKALEREILDDEGR